MVNKYTDQLPYTSTTLSLHQSELAVLLQFQILKVWKLCENGADSYYTALDHTINMEIKRQFENIFNFRYLINDKKCIKIFFKSFCS